MNTNPSKSWAHYADRTRHGDENFSTLRRTALSLLKQEKTAKCGIKNKRLTAGWDDDYMEKVLFSR